MEIALIFVAVFAIVVVFGIIRSRRIHGEINQNGIETDAVVSRVKERVQSDGEGVSVSYTYYVASRTVNGQSAEAQLGRGKSVDFRIGKQAWDYDLEEGSQVRIKYLPDKPDYAIRIG